MKRTLNPAHVLAALVAMGCVPTAPSAAAQQPARPNLILILADDLGYECLGTDGGTSYKTPALDRLAATGVRFDRCYVQPLCTPTRVQVMTGQYNVRNYDHFGYIDPKATTFAHILKKAGYATGIAGKWQLGRDPGLPRALGFDESCLWQHTRRPSRYKNPGLEINGREADYTRGEYGPDIVSDYALDFIARKKDGPFFLYYPMMLTHAPYEPTPDSPDYAGGASGPRNGRGSDRTNPHFADMVAYMDKLVGKLVARLEELGLRENTLVLFVGDNGTGAGTRSMMGERLVVGGKGKTTETGMHVPCIASWPAKHAPDRVCRDLVDSTDILPTLCEAAGVPLPSGLTIDGRSFLPQVRGEAGRPRDWIYCWYSREGVPSEAREFAADGHYKLYRKGELYDLTRDLGEAHPLPASSLDQEARAAKSRLQAVLDRYRGARPPSLAKPAGAATKKARRRAEID